MPFKGIHGHTRHTHEDKVDEKQKGKKKANNELSAVNKEVDLYNQPFEPFVPSKTAHYVNRFFRRSAQTVVHCVLALSPHFYMHTDELFDWMMPYERMGALLSEDAADYVEREEARKRKLIQEGKHQRTSCDGERDVSSSSCSSVDTGLETSLPNTSVETNQSETQSHDSLTMEEMKTMRHGCLTRTNSAPSSLSCANTGTNSEVQVNPANPKNAVHPKMSHYHPPFLVIDSRREDEYKESHIHGAYNIHYVPPKLVGEKFNFTLPTWVDKDTPIITYCTVGLRSGLMVWELRKRGYKFVQVLSGGYYKWVNEGRPIYASGELTRTVLQQHKLAGIMLRKELKSEQKKLKVKEALDRRVSSHHATSGQDGEQRRKSSVQKHRGGADGNTPSRRKSSIEIHKGGSASL